MQEENSTLSENLESYQKMLSHEQNNREETSAEVLELRAALRTVKAQLMVAKLVDVCARDEDHRPQRRRGRS